MRRLLHPLGLVLRLNARQKLAIFYGLLFPLIFLAAFRALYRWESVPLIRHVGELLTVVALGGACFALPVTLVAERERGVWRRLRLTPDGTGRFLTATLVGRLILLIISALTVIGLARLLGMPPVAHPLELAVGFLVVAYAFSGLGLLLAMLANSVPAAQALGQSVFLPMLVFGGIVVQVATLPAWSQRLATYLPGRYSVDLLQACANGTGLGAEPFALGALLAMGTGAFVSAAGLFRWDPHGRRERGRGLAWLGVAAGVWVAVGLLAARIDPPKSLRPEASVATSAKAPAPAPPTASRPTTSNEVANAPAVELPAFTLGVASAPPSNPSESPAPTPSESTATSPTAPATRAARFWYELTPADVAAVDLVVPPDEGVVAPMPGPGDAPDADTQSWLDYIRPRLPEWAPGRIADPVQRVRNLICAAAVPDVVQMDPFERFFPPLILEHLQATLPREDLAKALAWIVLHPDEGSLTAADQVPALGIEVRTTEVDAVRERLRYYAMKFLTRVRNAPPASAQP